MKKSIINGRTMTLTCYECDTPTKCEITYSDGTLMTVLPECPKRSRVAKWFVGMKEG